MMEALANSVAILCIILGSILSLIGGLGMHRLRDFYARLHAVGITDTLCSLLILTGLAIYSDSYLVSIKLLLIFAFLFFTSPTASFSLGNNAWRWGLRPQALAHPSVKQAEKTQ